MALFEDGLDLDHFNVKCTIGYSVCIKKQGRRTCDKPKFAAMFVRNVRKGDDISTEFDVHAASGVGSRWP